MKVEILNEQENKLLQRKELDFLVKELKVTPSRIEIIKKIAALKGVPEENIVIEKIRQEFGKKEAKVKARIYKEKNQLMKIEAKYVLERGKKKAQTPEKEEKKDEKIEEEKKK